MEHAFFEAFVVISLNAVSMRPRIVESFRGMAKLNRIFQGRLYIKMYSKNNSSSVLVFSTSYLASLQISRDINSGETLQFSF